MRYLLHFRLVGLLLLATLLCSACQRFIPSVQGLKTVEWPSLNYQRQDQIEVQWKDKSFSFLLYQQQQGQALELVALSLTGQPLFQVVFDGQKVIVKQRIDQMKLLPFDYVVRDLLYATYPNYKTQAQIKNEDNKKIVSINHQTILNILMQDHLIELNNIQVPYQMIISPVDESLENDGEINAQ